MRYKATYKFIVIINLCILMNVIHLRAQTVAIGSGFTDTMLCLNESFTVPVVVSGTFAMANFFKVELSDASGSFTSPTIIGTLYGLVSGNANCTLPTSITAGTGYRIRATATVPAYASNPFPTPIRISNFPTVNAATGPPVCVGDTVQLSATSPNPFPTFSWTGPNNFTSTLQNPNIYNAQQAAAGKYLVYVTSYTCTSYDSINVVISASPEIVTFTNSSPVCEDDDLTISMTTNVPNAPPTSFALTLPTNKVINSAGLWVEHTAIKDHGLYFLKFSIGNCWDTASTFVTIKPKPDTPKATSNSPICLGDTLLLNGSTTTTGVTYRWEGPNNFSGTGLTQSKANISKTDEGDYILYASKGGCESAGGTTKLQVGIPLVALAIKGDSVLCPGERMQLSVNTNEIDGIEWKKTDDTTVVSKLRTFSRVPVLAGDAGTYVVTQEILGCKSPPSFITVTVPDIRPPAPKANGPLCLGETLNLTADTTINGSYAWTGPGGFMSNAQNPVLNNVSEATEGIYKITTQLEHCSLTDSTEVIIKPMPEVQSISSNSPLCTLTELLLFAKSSLPNSTFEWTGPNNFKSDKQNPVIDSFKTNMTGTYQVRVITDNCVSGYKSTDVEGREGPGSSVAKNNGPIKEGETLNLYANNDKPGVDFSWEGPLGFTSNEANPTIPIATYRHSGDYTLTSTYNTCITKTTTTVNVIDILGITLDLYPNPNEGKFTIKGITQTDETLTLNILNHQGMLVYKSQVVPDRSKFDTKVDITGAPSGVYILQLISAAEKKTVRFTIIAQ